MEWIMKRRFGMWIGILLVLIVGVSVTQMTKDFVVSKGVAASSILNVMDMDQKKIDAAPAGGALVEAAAETEAAAQMEVFQAEERKADAPAEAAPVMAPAMADGEAVPEMAAALEETAAEAASPVAGMTGGPGAEYGASSNAEGKIASPIGPDGAAAYPGAQMDGETEQGPAEKMIGQKTKITANQTIQETVKSPLDPVVDTTENVAEVEMEEAAMTAEDFFSRFEAAEASALKFWENVTADNPVAYYAAAEQERVLWDYELNLVYGTIRERMDEKKAEELKVSELNWLKERDQYAEKMASKSPMLNAQKQDPAYTRVLAEKTKERCYWLVAEYEDVLNSDIP